MPNDKNTRPYHNKQKQTITYRNKLWKRQLKNGSGNQRFQADADETQLQHPFQKKMKTQSQPQLVNAVSVRYQHLALRMKPPTNTTVALLPDNKRCKPAQERREANKREQTEENVYKQQQPIAKRMQKPLHSRKPKRT